MTPSRPRGRVGIQLAQTSTARRRRTRQRRRSVKADLTERMIGIDADQMRAIPEVIVIAFGMAKVPAMRAVLRSGLIDGVVTHTALARAFLDVT